MYFVTQIKYNIDSMEIFRGQTHEHVHGYDSSLLAAASCTCSRSPRVSVWEMIKNK